MYSEEHDYCRVCILPHRFIPKEYLTCKIRGIQHIDIGLQRRVFALYNCALKNSELQKFFPKIDSFSLSSIIREKVKIEDGLMVPVSVYYAVRFYSEWNKIIEELR